MQSRTTSANAELTHGRLEGISCPDLLWALCETGKTGLLKVSWAGTTRSLYLQDGKIVFAQSDDPNERLGEMLLGEAMIDLDQFDRAVDRLGQGKRLGTLLVEIGAISPDDLVQAVLRQVRRTVHRLFPMQQGVYEFIEGSLPTAETITLDMRTAELLHEGARQVQSFERIRRSVGSPGTCFRLTRDWQQSVEGLQLGEGERTLLRELEGGARSVEQLCEAILLSNFEIYQTLWVFSIIGAVEECETPAGAESPSLEGRLGPEGLTSVLVQLCRDQETGVLYASHGRIDRAFHLREGRLVFATSNQIDDGLLHHLLRRGVISVRDREETAKRLLSNKRVGTILLEMGVIDDDDLMAMVREQLTEIVYDTLNWAVGQYSFVSGELPTIEEIILQSSIEDLILSGVRRIQSWSRIVAGSGGLDQRMRLTPEFLTLLDRMSVGPDEWDVVAALRRPLTLREVCVQSHLPDFRVAQVVWALQLTGVVERADVPADEARVDESAEAVAVAEPLETVEEPLPSEDPVPFEAEAEAEAPERIEAAADEFAEELVDEFAEEPVEDFASAQEDNDRWDEPPAVELDSPTDATIFIPAEQVQAALAEESPEFELDDFADDEPESAPAEDEAPAFEFDDPAESADRAAQTLSLEREAVEEALEQSEPAMFEAADPSWEPPEDLDRTIHLFNEMQRLLYRSIRSEVGAGAANFVRSCGVSLEDPFGTMLTSVDLESDGAWEAGSLRQAIMDRQLSTPWDGFRQLIDEELERLEIHLGDARAAALRDRLDAMIGEDPQTALPPE